MLDTDINPLLDDGTATRAEFLRRTTGGALGLGLLGGLGFDALGLLSADEAHAATPRSPNDVLRFRSRPDLRPPRLTIVKGGASDRCLFLSPSSGAGQRGALISRR